MRKRILLSLIVLLLAIIAVFADTTVTVKLSVTRTGSNNNYRYTTKVKSITSAPESGIVLTYSTNQNGPFSPAPVDTIVSNEATGTVYLYFEAADSSFSGTSSRITVDTSGFSKNVNTKEVSFTITISAIPGNPDNDKLGDAAKLYYFPRNVVNNSNVLVDLTNAKSMLPTDFNDVYENHSTNNLALFRIRENLMSDKVGSRTAVSNVHEYITIIIESPDGWTFVNEYNSTRTTTFTLDAFCVEQTLNYGADKVTTYPASPTVALGPNTTLASGEIATFEKVGNHYELVLPYTYFCMGTNRYYPKYFRNADICLNIPQFGTGLEPGYYTTELTVKIPEHTEVEANTLDGTICNYRELTITVRGFLGIEGTSSGSSSFYVETTDYTYSMDLGIAANPEGGYPVAEAVFTFFDYVVGPEGKTNREPRPANPELKYTIYVSSTSDYNDTTTPFSFTKIGSERQARTNENTIYYRLEWESKDHLYDNPLYDNQTEAPLFMRPKYTYKQLSRKSSGSSGRDSYELNWQMDNIIKLYLTDESLQTYAYHQEGLYYSYIYFTLVSN